MSTLGELVAEIRSDIHRGSDYDDRIKSAIRAAIRHYREERLRFNTTSTFITTSASVETIWVPADLIEIDSLRYEQADDRRVLYERTPGWMNDQQFGNSFGEPMNYTIELRRIRFGVIPDATYTLICTYQYDLTDISVSASDGAENAWLIDGYDLVKQHAMADLHANYIRGPESSEQAARCTAQELQIFDKLKSRAMREQSTGRLRSHPV